jgi:hypothetical protein
MTDNIYDSIIVAEDISSHLMSEQKTTELKFISGKLHQKVFITDYSNGYVSHRWDEVEGQ